MSFQPSPIEEYIDIDLGVLNDICRGIDIVIPYMFCKSGMTTYRGLFEDVFRIPIVGSSLATTSLATNKWYTRCIAQQSGVRVPEGVLISDPGEVSFTGPVIVKPVQEDNSLGVSLVTEESALTHAVAKAGKYGTQILIEEFIKGQEARVGLVEINDSLRVLPMIHYQMSKDHPIRTADDKVSFDPDGKGRNVYGSVSYTCPAHFPTAIQKQLEESAVKMHRALGCKDFSLFDFRIQEGTNQVFLLEACLFWTFSPVSIISEMLIADGADLTSIYHQIWLQASQRII
ncbi:MAG: hypothetical protein OXH65_03245 [Paracoccaceae bacterium]|nr:hypothetical protein [Paracoccaceae bacterium]MDE2674105.1 hypothetical protein [Paracoccaceae bacterium]